MNPVRIVKIIATVVSTAVALWYVFHKQIEWNKDDATVWDQIFNRLLDRGARAEKRVARGKETPDDLYSTPEQIFLTLAYLQTEVNNGGFDQFFFNTHDSLNDLLVLSAETVKAFDHHALAIHILKAKGTADAIHTFVFSPLSYGVEQSTAYVDVVDEVEPAESHHVFLPSLIGSVVDHGGHAPHYLPVVISQEIVGFAKCKSRVLVLA